MLARGAGLARGDLNDRFRHGPSSPCAEEILVQSIPEAIELGYIHDAQRPEAEGGEECTISGRAVPAPAPDQGLIHRHL